ncbi:barstar family protein [Pseudoduganella albidiflava]|nr:barstar family protein [Pseudoduganella albidiflava]QBI03057.1 barnase inhibitor [Pseudoduganella albidiflava]
MELELDGQAIRSEADFHAAIMAALPFPHYYGRNLDALWDVLSTDVERPVRMVWRHSAFSREAMGERFDTIVSILRDVERQDVELNFSGRFSLVLD